MKIFSGSLIGILGIILIILDVMRGDVGRFIGGDTPIMTIVQILGGLYLLYWANQSRKS